MENEKLEEFEMHGTYIYMCQAKNKDEATRKLRDEMSSVLILWLMQRATTITWSSCRATASAYTLTPKRTGARQAIQSSVVFIMGRQYTGKGWGANKKRQGSRGLAPPALAFSAGQGLLATARAAPP